MTRTEFDRPEIARHAMSDGGRQQPPRQRVAGGAGRFFAELPSRGPAPSFGQADREWLSAAADLASHPRSPALLHPRNCGIGRVLGT